VNSDDLGNKQLRPQITIIMAPVRLLTKALKIPYRKKNKLMEHAGIAFVSICLRFQFPFLLFHINSPIRIFIHSCLFYVFLLFPVALSSFISYPLVWLDLHAIEILPELTELTKLTHLLSLSRPSSLPLHSKIRAY